MTTILNTDSSDKKTDQPDAHSIFIKTLFLLNSAGLIAIFAYGVSKKCSFEMQQDLLNCLLYFSLGLSLIFIMQGLNFIIHNLPCLKVCFNEKCAHTIINIVFPIISSIFVMLGAREGYTFTEELINNLQKTECNAEKINYLNEYNLKRIIEVEKDIKIDKSKLKFESSNINRTP